MWLVDTAIPAEPASGIQAGISRIMLFHGMQREMPHAIVNMVASDKRRLIVRRMARIMYRLISQTSGVMRSRWTKAATVG